MHPLPVLRMLDQHPGRLSDMCFIERCQFPFRQLQQHLAPPVFLLGGDGVVYPERHRPRPFGIAEDVQLRDVQIFQETPCLLEVCRRLAPCADDDIYPDERLRQYLLDLLYLMPEEGGVIPPPHELQHAVRPALQRDMEMRHEAPAPGHEVNRLVCDEVRLDGRYAVSLNAFHPIQCPDEVEERLARRLPEVADVHSRQHDFASPLARHLFGLADKARD